MGTAYHLLEPVAVTWSIAGLIASALVAAAAFIRSRGPGGFYDRDVYGMTARAHLRYAIASAAFEKPRSVASEGTIAAARHMDPKRM